MLGSHLGAGLLNTLKKCELALDSTVERVAVWPLVVTQELVDRCVCILRQKISL